MDESLLTPLARVRLAANLCGLVEEKRFFVGAKGICDKNKGGDTICDGLIILFAVREGLNIADAIMRPIHNEEALVHRICSETAST